MSNKKMKRWCWGGTIFLVVIVVVIVAIVLNRVWIYDWYRGMSYQSTVDMVGIRDRLGLTERGKFLFNASQPELNDADDFNKNCRQDETEVAVLGCYTVGNIYVYNITEAELEGIRELTTAHELLHAVWARMSNDEKKALQPVLQQVYNDNLEILQNDIETYNEMDRVEEIFVRAGTEIKILPRELERYYTEIFVNQDRIVDYYNGYIEVFRAIEERMDVLTSEMEELGVEIEAAMVDYNRQASQLEADIVSFNSCAEVAGCFRDENEFYAQRASLLARQDALAELNTQINDLIAEYNSRVEEYNANVTESRKLQNIINSNSTVEI